MANDIYGSDGDGERNDCAVRALAVAACIPYDSAHLIYQRLGRKPRRRLELGSVRTPKAVQIANGGKYPNIIKRPGTIARFLTENGQQGHWVITVAGHQLAIVDGQIYDWPRLVPKTRRIIRNAYRVA